MKPPGLGDPTDQGKALPAQTKQGPRSSSRPSLEKIHELAEEEAVSQFTLSGMQDSMDRYGNSSSPLSEDLHGRPSMFEPSEVQEKPPLRRVQKRFARNEDLEERADYGTVAKKFKAETVTMNNAEVILKGCYAHIFCLNVPYLP